MCAATITCSAVEIAIPALAQTAVIETPACVINHGQCGQGTIGRHFEYARCSAPRRRRCAVEIAVNRPDEGRWGTSIGAVEKDQRGQHPVGSDFEYSSVSRQFIQRKRGVEALASSVCYSVKVAIGTLY